MSAPWSRGFCIYGLRNVLSTTTIMPCRWAMVATALMSTRPKVGLLGDSIHISFVSFGRINSATSNSILGEKVTWTPCAAATFVKYRWVPP